MSAMNCNHGATVWSFKARHDREDYIVVDANSLLAEELLDWGECVMDISTKQEKWRQERPLFEAEFLYSNLLPFFNFNENTGDYE